MSNRPALSIEALEFAARLSNCCPQFLADLCLEIYGRSDTVARSAGLRALAEISRSWGLRVLSDSCATPHDSYLAHPETYHAMREYVRVQLAVTLAHDREL